MDYDYEENGGKKHFLQIRSFNIVYPNMENKIPVPITKKMEIIMCIHIYLISLMIFDYTENGGKKAFLVNLKYQYHVSQWGELDCRANNKKNRDYY